MYRCIDESAPVRLINELVMTKNTHEVFTRSTQIRNVQVPQPNREIFRKSFKYQGALLWNSLPAQLKSAADLNVFKKQYKELYFK